MSSSLVAVEEPGLEQGIAYLQGGRLDPDAALEAIEDRHIEPEDEPRMIPWALQTKNTCTVRLYGFNDDAKQMWCTIGNRREHPMQVVFALMDRRGKPVAAFKTVMPGSPPPRGDNPFARICFCLPVKRDRYTITILRAERSLVEPVRSIEGARRASDD